MLKNKFTKLLMLAIFLRLLVSAFLFHPDIKTIAFQTSFLKKGVVNIYPYLAQNKSNLPIREEFVYFPLTYFVLGGYQAIISPFLGNGFGSWLADAGTFSAAANPSVFWYLLFLKLPLLISDIAIAYMIRGFFKRDESKDKATTIWLFNPFTIFLIYGYSNIDIYAVLLTVGAFFLLRRKRIIASAIVFGLASAFKMYPLLFVPFLIFYGKNLREKVILFITPVIVLLLTIIPFLSSEFVKSALVSGLTTRIFSPAFNVGFGESIILGLVIISALFLYALIKKERIAPINYFIIILLTIFSFSHFHISWLLWISPFLVVLLVKRPNIIPGILLWSTVAVCIPLLYDDRSMTISLFRLYSSWFETLPTPFLVIQKFYDSYSLQSMLHSVLAGFSFVISYTILNKKTLKIKS